MNITLFQDKLGNYWKENKPSNGADHLQKNCNGTKTVEAVLECINNKTYSLGEAIIGNACITIFCFYFWPKN